MQTLRPTFVFLRYISSNSLSVSTVIGTTSIPMDTPITDHVIAIIAGEYLVRWEELAPHLKLTVPQEESIRATFRVYGDQKCEVLRTWKRNNGNGATYRTFITAAENASNRQLADDIRALLQKLSQNTLTGL